MQAINKTSHKNTSGEFNYLLLVMMVLLFIPVLFKPMINAPDTESYLSLTSQRPPLFALVLHFDYWMTGKHFLLTRLLQIGLVLVALMYLDKWLRHNMGVSKFATFVLAFMFLFPLIYHAHLGCLLLSEALSIPFYIFMTVALCQLFLTPTVKTAIKLSVVIGLLILTRNQFYFLYGFLLLGVAWCCYLRLGLKQIAQITAIFLFCVGFTTLASTSYHKILHGSFSNTSADGPLLFVQPFFFSSESDVQYFNDPREKNAFLAAYSHAKQQGFLEHGDKVSHPGFNLGWDNLPRYVHFVDVFDPIQFESATAISQFTHSSYLTDHVMQHIASVLFMHHLKQNLSFYSWKFSYSLGGPLLLIIFLLLAVVALVASLRNPKDPAAVVAFVLLCLVFANNLTISISEMVLTRYLIYPGFTLSVLILILFSKAMLPIADKRMVAA